MKNIIDYKFNENQYIEEFQKYSKWEPKHPWLVVDDVYTTGTSFKEFCTTKETMFAYKWVVFARQPTDKDSGVRALFTMP